MGHFAATGHNGQITDRQNNFMLKGGQFVGLLILIIRENTESQFFDDQGRKQIRFLIDEKRVTKQADYRTSRSAEIIGLSFTSSDWDNIINSESTRFRISKQQTIPQFISST